MPFDQLLFDALYRLAHRNQFLDWLLVFLADYLIYILVVVFIYFLLRHPDWRERFYFFALAGMAVILSRGIITPVIRYLYDRPRPFTVEAIEPLIHHAATHSFPSGHIAFLLPLLLAVWLIKRRAGWWLLILVVVIGLARVAVGAHWPSDILGGFLTGGLSFLAAYYVFRLKGLPKLLIETQDSLSPLDSKKTP